MYFLKQILWICSEFRLVSKKGKKTTYSKNQLRRTRSFSCCFSFVDVEEEVQFFFYSAKMVDGGLKLKKEEKPFTNYDKINFFLFAVLNN